MIAVSGILVAAFLPGVTSDADKARITRERMAKIEEATRAFMAKKLRRPCPSDASLAFGTANFGVEAALPGRCTGQTPAANFVNIVPSSGTITGIGATSATMVGTQLYSYGSRTMTTMTPNSGASTATSVIQVGAAVGSFTANANSVATGTRVVGINVGNVANTILLNKTPRCATATCTATFNTTTNTIVNPVVAGGVPTNTLGLGDEYALDGWGRRMIYTVDNRATDATSCHDMLSLGTRGAVQIKGASSVATASAIGNLYTDDNVMWALMSYGKGGHGAYPEEGGASRVSTRSTDPDLNNNAFYTYSAGTWTPTATNSTNVFVRKEPVTTPLANLFDDIVWSQEATKNTCCIGKYCNFGTRLDNSSLTSSWNGFAIGDINGDGIADFLYTYGPWGGAGNLTPAYVVFGSKTGWPQPGTGSVLDLDTALDGTNGFIIKQDPGVNLTFYGSGVSTAIGDVNGDGYDDIVIGGQTNIVAQYNTRVVVIFGGPGVRTGSGTSTAGWPATFIASTTNLNGTMGSWLTTDVYTNSNVGSPGIAIGDFTGHRNANPSDRARDLFIVRDSGSTGNTTANAFLVQGQTATWPATFDLSTINTTPTNTANSLAGFALMSSSHTAIFIDSYAVLHGDLNSDGIEDVAFGSTAYPGAPSWYTYLVFGRTLSAWPTTGSNPTSVDIATMLATIGNTNVPGLNSAQHTMAVFNYSDGNGINSVGDLSGHNNGVVDLPLNSGVSGGTTMINYNGLASTTAWLSTVYSWNGHGGASSWFNFATSTPAWVSSSGIPFIYGYQWGTIGDVNNDGRDDIVMMTNYANCDTQYCGPYTGRYDTTHGSVSMIVFQPAAHFSGQFTMWTTPKMDGTDGFYVISGAPDSHGGGGVAVADFNNDGTNDIIMSSQGNYAPTTHINKVFILYGRRNVPWDAWVDLGDLD